MDIKNLMDNQLRAVDSIERLMEKVKGKAEANKLSEVKKYCDWMRQVTSYIIEFEDLSKEIEQKEKQEDDFFH